MVRGRVTVLPAKGLAEEEGQGAGVVFSLLSLRPSTLTPYSSFRARNPATALSCVQLLRSSLSPSRSLSSTRVPFLLSDAPVPSPSMALLKSLVVLSAASIPLAQACAGAHYRPEHVRMRRQDVSSIPTAAGAATGVVTSTSPPSSVPLESIHASMATVAVPLTATPTAGQQPSITNAPALPSCTFPHTLHA